MSTPEAAIATVTDKRLHPWSWLFVLLQQLKQFLIPLAALLFFGRGGDRNELWPLIGIGVLAITSLLQYFTYRYRVDGDSLTIRSGWLHRSLRHVPFARIHNVVLHQSLLHRIFGVAEVRLESAGGDKPEAQMRVLRLDDALALEQLIRHRGVVPAGDAPMIADDVLLAMPTSEVIRHGLISNRGLIVVGAGVGALSQMSPRLLPNLFEGMGEAMFGWAGRQAFEPAQYVLAALSLVLLFVLLLRVLSIAMALLQYHGFRLSEHGRRLTVERGLLTRLRTSATRRRIQAWTLEEGLLHRLFKRRTLKIDTAVAETGNEKRALKELAPIATPSACDALIQHLLPAVAWPRPGWQPLHRNASWRLFIPGVLFALALTTALSWRFGAWGMLGLLWLPWSWYQSVQHAHRAGYSIDDGLIAVRGGWWSRYWRFAELDRLQALQLTRSPVDRRFGMATLHLDTAGASPMAPPLRIHYLPEAEARELYRRLGAIIATRKLHW
ncbi:MAG: PH domain-containing protein [Lysobacter sp.]|nr:PH domain-containing protein [Lysobacter sp.]